MAHRQNATGRLDTLLRHDHCAVVKGRVLEKYVLNEQLVDARVNDVTRFRNIIKRGTTLYYDERSYLSLGHTHASHHDRHDGFLVYIRALATTEEDHDTLETLMGTQGIKETTDFFLKKNDETDDSHAHQLVENGTQEAHLEHLTHKEPNEHKEHYADEDIERTALFHQPIDIIKHECHEHYVDDILDRSEERRVGKEC